MILVTLIAVPVMLGHRADAGEPEPIEFRPRGASEARFEAASAAETVEIDSGGTTISVDLYKPDTSSDLSWKQPVLIVFGTYADPGPPFPSQAVPNLVKQFTERGYAVVNAAMRGTFRSGGCFNNFGPKDAQDFGAVVRYFDAQDWSGKIGAIGMSNEGKAIIAGIAPSGSNEPEVPLTTAVVGFASSALYDEYGFDGVPYDLRWLNQSALPPLNTLTSARGGALAERTSCGDTAQGATASLDPSGTRSAYHRERDHRAGAESVRASVLYLVGLRDREMLPVALDGWYDPITSRKRAVISARGHVDVGRADLDGILDAWFDSELLGFDTGVADWPPVQVQDERNVWRAVASVADMGRPRVYWLGADGQIVDQPDEGVTTFTEFGEPVVWAMVLQEPLHLSGRAHLTAPITLDKPDANFVWRLEEIGADGGARTLVTGYLSAEHRESLDAPSPVKESQVYDYDIRTSFFDAWIGAGSQLRIVLSGHDRDPTPGEDLQVRGLPANTLFTATVNLGGAFVTLPISNDTCGLVVQQEEAPIGPVPGCPRRVSAHWKGP